MKPLTLEKKIAAGFVLAIIVLSVVGAYAGISLGAMIVEIMLAFTFVGAALWIVRKDIARRRLAEEMLARTNAKLAAVLDASTPVALIATDTQGVITFFNTGAERMLGYSAEEVMGQATAGSLHLDSESTADAQEMTNGRSQPGPSLDAMVESARRGEVEECERTFVRKDGSRLTGSTAVTALRESNGEIIGFMTVAKDITERKRAEELLRARNEELRAFAYTVSHDLKAPLRGIAGYAQELTRRHSDGMTERAHFCLTQILTATRNLDELIEDLLLYSRLDAESPSVTDVNVVRLIEGILKHHSLGIAERKTEIAIAISFTTIRTWQRGLAQVLTNLTGNALKYSHHANPPRISICGEEMADSYRLSIADNGIGFDMKYHDRIFGLFNRLVRAEEFEGTGAGLAIAKKLLDKMEGKIWAESRPGVGATFFIELPRPVDAPSI